MVFIGISIHKWIILLKQLLQNYFLNLSQTGLDSEALPLFLLIYDLNSETNIKQDYWYWPKINLIQINAGEISWLII